MDPGYTCAKCGTSNRRGPCFVCEEEQRKEAPQFTIRTVWPNREQRRKQWRSSSRKKKFAKKGGDL